MIKFIHFSRLDTFVALTIPFPQPQPPLGEYWKYVDQYFKTRTDASFAGLYHQIHIDIPRTNPAVQLFQHMVVQEVEYIDTQISSMFFVAPQARL